MMLKTTLPKLSGPGFRLPGLVLLGILSLLLVSANQSFSQETTITGTVTDAIDESSLPGVNIIEAGTTNGTVTDIDGNYEITVSSPDAVLQFTFVGYLTEEIQVNGRETINVALSQSIEMLSEMVVIGYGVQKKEDLTGSIAVVDMEDLNEINPVSFDQALQGRAAGVHVSPTSGRPGAAATVKIRGIGSISRNSEPLYIVDGVPLSGGAINAINPNDIESLQVLKDASATAIYGTRGANGVIVITTKRGDKNENKMSYSGTFRSSQIPRQFDIMNADQYSQLMKEAWTNFARTDSTDALFSNLYLLSYSPEARAANGIADRSTNFQDALTQRGTGMNHQLSFSGGNEKSTYYISGNYYDEDGIMINTGMDRLALSANSDFEISDRITFGSTINLSQINYVYDSHFTNFNSWYVSLIASPLMALYDENAIGGYGGPVQSITGGNERTNPVAEQMLNENTAQNNRAIANAYFDFQIFDGLTFTVRGGGEYANNHSRQWSPVYTLGDEPIRNNEVSSLMETSSNTQNWQIGTYLEYANTFGDHNLTLLGAYERLENNGNYILAAGNNIAFDDLNVLNQVLAEDGKRTEGNRHTDRFESGFARVSYDYDGKYLLIASFRRDGSTLFAPGNRYGNFPSFSAGWKINEDFFPNSNLINMMKLRFGWGQTGNANLDRFQYLDLIDPFNRSRYTFGEAQDLYLGGASITFQSSPQLQWEAAEMTNFGLDVELLESAIQFTAEYYIKNQDQMLVQKPISSIFGKRINWGSGWPTVGAWMNLAQIQNRGLELSLTYRNYEGEVGYRISGNFSTLKNEIIDLGVNEFASDLTLQRNGHTIGSFFGYIAERILQEDDFLQDENGELVTNNDGEYTILHAYQEVGTAPGDIKFADLNNDGKITDEDRTIIGKPLPDFIYGLDISLDWNGFDFNLFLNGMQNMDVYNQLYATIGMGTNATGKDENRLVETLNFWTPENPSTEYTRAHVQDPNNNARISTWHLEDASFLRVRSVQIGYTFPSHWMTRIGVTSFRVFGSANNLFTFTGYRGYDPEVSSQNPLRMGVDGGTYPVPRTFLFGVELDI